ncbi:MAG: HD domain-containing phosphohydrolase [Gemmatimonadaceae bacterium]
MAKPSHPLAHAAPSAPTQRVRALHHPHPSLRTRGDDVDSLGSTSSSLSEVLSALSHAFDLTAGQSLGHTMRTCAIGMRLGEELGLGEEQRCALYYALLLKDSGCSSNAARMAALFGSQDQTVKARMKLVDWENPVRLVLYAMRNSGLGRSLPRRVMHFLRLASTGNVTRDLIQIRCDRGADIALRLGFPSSTGEAIRSLDEHWCGVGYPAGRCGEEIPLLSRIANLAQTVDVFFHAHGVHAALAMARQRRGRWFDPALVDLMLPWRDDRVWWARLATGHLAAEVVAAEPGDARRVTAAGLDDIARAFADIIDAKSPYTSRHSSSVAAIARGIARASGLSEIEQHDLYRAGLLHDIGKLGVSSAILDKPGMLTPDERRVIERHPAYTWEILSRVSAFDDFAWTAAIHHEKLDGSGYPWGLEARHLDAGSRILGVADMYEALTADRPYRAGMSREKALGILESERGTKLCGAALDGLQAIDTDVEIAVAELAA